MMAEIKVIFPNYSRLPYQGEYDQPALWNADEIVALLLAPLASSF